MTDFIFPIPTPSIKISGRPERFAVRRIFCVGRNYAEHARNLAMMSAIRRSFSPSRPMRLSQAAPL
jgi:2-keto-4-pentenoate hydratase/2-oxohepta-3-ene-1,7-dioic acid hydratase in catechol pathway